jgi:hypothetical protein
VRNPFQSADLRSLPWWEGVALYEEKNRIFEQLTQELESAFRAAVESGELAQFGKEYGRIAKTMVEQLPGEPLLPAILDHSFKRLITIYCYIRQRRRSRQEFLSRDSSVVTWQLERKLLAKAIDQADCMQQSGVTHQQFDVKSSPSLFGWLLGNYWPLVRRFSGMAAVPITDAHIRCISTDKDGRGYKDRFQFHRFGNHHFDQDVYSLPLIIYLSDVSENCGPFEYLSAADKYSHNFVLRAFHQSLNHDCKISSLEQSSFPTIARLPAVFRGGDVIGNLYLRSEFERAGPVTVTGGLGTTVMFDGFNVIHAGGFPAEGCRKSLFVNFRFPIAKMIPKFRLLFLARQPALGTGMGV